MSTPDHLQPVDVILAITLSQQARGVSDLSRTLMMENQSFLVSQTPHDAGRVARTLRYMIKQAEIAALSFEAAARSGGVCVDLVD